jgi:CRP-like cAMP-binding protein
MSNNQSLWYLENIDVTGLFCPKKVGRGEVDQHSHKVFKKGEYIYLPDEQADRLYFLTEGRVKIGSYADNGKEITKAILNKGEVFGELSLIGEETRRDFAYAMEDTSLCTLTVPDMKALMRDHNSLSLFLMKIMGSRMLEMEQRLEALVFKDSRTRIIEFLHSLATNKGQRVGYEQVVRKFMTHQEIANLTATSRQTVTTVLNDLRNKNILTFDRRRLLVRDMELLAKESQLN